jgi:threonine dehydratase
LRPLEPPPLEEVRAAQQRIQGVAVRTPLLRLDVDAPCEIWLKLENLQPIGSFKLRGAANAMRLAGPARLARGVYTASAGNMAQGVAWNARAFGVPCSVVVPEQAPRTKLLAIERLGGKLIPVPFDVWWRVVMEHRFEGQEGLFIHPVSDPAVIAGNGTIALEILEELPGVDAVAVPFGGGGLSCGIAAVMRELSPGTRVWACEVETAAPLTASLLAGEPRTIEHTPSFVDGIGGKSVLDEMWPMARRLLAGALVVSIRETESALRLLAGRARVIAEGAGAVPVAAALAGKAGPGKVVCVVSGGNIDLPKLAAILAGETPGSAETLDGVRVERLPTSSLRTSGKPS